MNFTYKLFPEWIQWLSKVPDYRVQARCQYSLYQTLFCGLSLFLLRHRSLRAFTMELRGNTKAQENFQRWIHFKDVPSDDEIRYILSTVSTASMNGLLKNFHQRIQRQKILSQKSNSHKLLGKFELISLDGTGQLSSDKIGCEKCLTRQSTDSKGQTLTKYLHGQLLLSLTDLFAKYSLPFQFEPIERSDSETQYSKNDCELNAAKRALQKLKTTFPKRAFCFLGDNLFAVQSTTELIRASGWHFIFTAKPERNKELFFMWEYLKDRRQYLQWKDRRDHIHQYSWINGLPLKQAKFKESVPEVNLLLYEEISEHGEVIYNSSWITDISIDQESVKSIARAGRARFAIENRNFNEQKNLGYQSEHNFGHFGNLPNVFFGLQQIAQLIVELFRFWRPGAEMIRQSGSKRRYFETLAVLVAQTILPDDGVPILYLKFDFNTS